MPDTPHVHDDECRSLRSALESQLARQQPPRGAMDPSTGIAVLPDRATQPEGETGDVEVEIARLRETLQARGCEPIP
jgi:hypothetical protein